ALLAVRRFRLREFSALERYHLSQPPSQQPSPDKIQVLKNPFVPHKNAQSGRWAPPKYSLRRQAEIVKAAKASGRLDLLPPGPKYDPRPLTGPPKSVVVDPTLEAWERPVVWRGKFRRRWVPGANIGAQLYAGKRRMFKGHAWERKFKMRQIRIRILMRDMHRRIQRYKTWHKLRRPKPLEPARDLKPKKLPF
ncbi:hypothetical protein K488DRAFT_15064, partial [Vararia minispora EC-137]